MLDRQFRLPSQASNPGWVSDYRFAALIVGMVWIQLFYMTTAFPGLAPIGRPVKLALLGISVCLVLWRSKLSWLLLRTLNPGMLPMVGLCWLSTLWSIERGLTINRMITFTSLFMVCLAFGLVSWRRDKFQQLVLPFITFVMLLSFVYYFIDRDFVMEEGIGISLEGAWRGVTLQKNSFGQVAAFGVILWFHRWLCRTHRPFPTLVGLGISASCLIMSKSSTSLLSAIFAVMFLVLLLRSPPNLRRWTPIIVVAFSVLVITYSMAVLRVVPGLDVLLKPITWVTGKDSTFSARSMIWEVIREHIRFSPMLGSGCFAYWAGAKIPWSPSYIFYAKMYFYPGQAHNGYLEIINDVGYIGISLLAVYLYFFVRQGLRVLSFDRPLGALFLSLFFMQTMTNLSQSIWFQGTSFEWVIMMFATVAMARTLLEHKLRGVYGSPTATAPTLSPPDWQLRIR